MQSRVEHACTVRHETAEVACEDEEVEGALVAQRLLWQVRWAEQGVVLFTLLLSVGLWMSILWVVIY